MTGQKVLAVPKVENLLHATKPLPYEDNPTSLGSIAPLMIACSMSLVSTQQCYARNRAVQRGVTGEDTGQVRSWRAVSSRIRPN